MGFCDFGANRYCRKRSKAVCEFCLRDGRDKTRRELTCHLPSPHNHPENQVSQEDSSGVASSRCCHCVRRKQGPRMRERPLTYTPLDLLCSQLLLLWGESYLPIRHSVFTRIPSRSIEQDSSCTNSQEQMHGEESFHCWISQIAEHWNPTLLGRVHIESKGRLRLQAAWLSESVRLSTSLK